MISNINLTCIDTSFNISSLSHAEMRRRMHIQSEQKRRAEIKDGFEDLRRQLPISNHSRKMSKAMLLQKSKSKSKKKIHRVEFRFKFISIIIYIYKKKSFLSFFSCFTYQEHENKRMLSCRRNQS